MTALMATNLSRAAESGAAHKANCLEKSLAVDFQKLQAAVTQEQSAVDTSSDLISVLVAPLNTNAPVVTNCTAQRSVYVRSMEHGLHGRRA